MYLNELFYYSLVTNIKTKITKDNIDVKRYLLSFYNTHVEVIIVLTQNELEVIQDQLEDILLETLDS
ncbi:unnamed protein product [marine sediment metagenome]|uniref:Uncharacterized protein n=1 Tax=marine sediment metagenome TaxID=412755 RepID=X0ZGK2_9ZZZZ